MRPRSAYRFEYPGDHPDKRAARLFLYKHALRSPRNGLAIVLAGTAPESEVTLLKDYLRWPAKNTWFVDNSRRPEVIAAFHKIIRLWPQAMVYPGKLQSLPIVYSTSIGFVNLDFMGHLNEFNVIPCLKLVIPRLLSGAVLGLTWERGRERLNIPKSAGAKIISAGAGFDNLNDKRWAGVIKTVSDLAKGSLRLLGGVEYQNHHSPMSVTVFEKI